MRNYTLFVFLLVSILLIFSCSFAQDSTLKAKQPSSPRHEITIGDGMVSTEQIKGWVGPPILTRFISEPNGFTGAAFITYRYFVVPELAIGCAIGLDNEQGKLSYGSQGYGGTGAAIDATTGQYAVHSCTFAWEVLWVYKRNRERPGMLYGFAGIGITSFDELFTIYSNDPYGPPVALPSNPYDYHVNHYNFQVTPFGYRSGKATAVFVELGYGYKGLIRGGLSVGI